MSCERNRIYTLLRLWGIQLCSPRAVFRKERKKALLLALVVLMKVVVECMLYVFAGVFMLTENGLSVCLFKKKQTSFSSKCDFLREMTFYKHTLVFFNMKKKIPIYNIPTLPLQYHLVSSCMCPVSVGLTETPELGLLLQPMLGL